MARKFFYVSSGILCLVAAYQLGALSARADVDVTNPGPVLVAGMTVWGADGSAWSASNWTWYRLAPSIDLPVPASEVAMIEGEDASNYFLVTHSGEVWRCAGVWDQMPLFPGGPVAIEHESAGSVKGKYR